MLSRSPRPTSAVSGGLIYTLDLFPETETAKDTSPKVSSPGKAGKESRHMAGTSWDQLGPPGVMVRKMW